LYSQNTCAAAPSGEIFCLDSQETVAGQTGNGYVDKFKSDGTPDGKFYVGAPTASLSVEPVTGIIAVDGGLYDQNGGHTNTPAQQGALPGPVAGNAALGGYRCVIQPTATLDLSCVLVTGGGFAQPTVMSINVGTNPQAITMGTIGGKTYVYVVTGGNAPALWSVNVSDGMTNVTSQPVAGVTANLPGGSALTMFDSLGTGLLTSFGDNVAIPFSETKLTQGTAIKLPGIPVSASSTPNGIMVVGNADQPNAGGTLTEVNPATGTATLVPSVETSVMPVGTVSATTGKGFWVCPQDGTSSCKSYTLP
jgi:hypothetical protein